MLPICEVQIIVQFYIPTCRYGWSRRDFSGLSKNCHRKFENVGSCLKPSVTMKSKFQVGGVVGGGVRLEI